MNLCCCCRLAYVIEEVCPLCFRAWTDPTECDVPPKFARLQNAIDAVQSVPADSGPTRRANVVRTASRRRVLAGSG